MRMWIKYIFVFSWNGLKVESNVFFLLEPQSTIHYFFFHRYTVVLVNKKIYKTGQIIIYINDVPILSAWCCCCYVNELAVILWYDRASIHSTAIKMRLTLWTGNFLLFIHSRFYSYLGQVFFCAKTTLLSYMCVSVFDARRFL